MKYGQICEVYQNLENTSKGLEKTKIISDFLSSIENEPESIYLLQGRVFPDYEEKELGISQQLATKALAQAIGVKEEKIVEVYRDLGDLGLVAEKLISTKKQNTLFSTEVTTKKVLDNLKRLPSMEGKGAVDKKMALIVEILHACSSIEAKYFIRTIIGDMKIGVGGGILRDAIVDFCFSPKDIEEKKMYGEKLQSAYDKTADFAEVFAKASTNELDKITLSPGKPVKVMLFPKAKNIEDAFRIVGKPAAFEYKYDGFRVMINKDSTGKIKIFTRRLDEVTNQFPDIVEYVKTNVNAENFIIDGEAVGFNPKTKKLMPFQFISQRIRRKYDIEKLVESLPVELKIFDIIYLNGKSLVEEDFATRNELLKKIIIPLEYKINLAKQIVTTDEKEVEKFYEEALEDNQEGLMGKSLSAPYKPGARIGYAVKLKPQDEEFDLVITGAEWGTGKRAGWLTSFDVSCIDDEGNLQEIGKASSGLKEKFGEQIEKTENLQEESLSYEEMTNLLKEIIVEEHGTKVSVKPEIVVSVRYQNVQRSPTYSSGFALRFPRIIKLRPDRGISDIATIEDIKKIAE